VCADECRVCRPAVPAVLAAPRSGDKVALWSSLSFAGFAISNALVFADFVILRTGGVAIPLAATACVAGALLWFGLIWETE